MQAPNVNAKTDTDRHSSGTILSAINILKKGFRILHTVYGVIIFVLLFLIFFVLLLIPIIFKKKHSLVGIFNRWWAHSLFFLVGIPIQVEYRQQLDRSRQYIFCPNHFSYLDIPTVGLNKHNTIFVGKNDMTKIPLFGFMYRHLHITVNRDKLKSRYSSLVRSLHAIDEGKSLVIFPEGGILSTEIPRMTRFKDGAFRVAIEKQIPIVPVTIPYNWIILPPDQFILHRHLLKVIFHDPIDTQGLSLNDLDKLKDRTNSIISEELKKHSTHEN